MWVRCLDNFLTEDEIKVDRYYEVIENYDRPFSYRKDRYFIKNELGNKKWYLKDLFEISTGYIEDLEDRINKKSLEFLLQEIKECHGILTNDIYFNNPRELGIYVDGATEEEQWINVITIIKQGKDIRNLMLKK